MRVGAPDGQRSQARAILLQFRQYVLDHGVGYFRPARRLVEIDGQRLDLVAIFLEIILEFHCDFLRVRGHIAGPFRTLKRVEVVMVDGLLVITADGVHEIDERSGEDVGGPPDPFLTGRPHGGIVELGVARGLGVDLDPVGVDGVEQIADDDREGFACGLYDPGLVLRFKFVVHARETRSERTHRLLGSVSHHQTHGEILERDGWLGIERLAIGLERLADTDGIDDDVVGLGRSRRRDLPEVVGIKDAGPPALHLLEIVPRFDVAHEQQAFERLHVGAGGDHVDGNGDARVVVVAKGCKRGLGVPGTVSDLAAEVVALAELLPDGLDDVVGVAVGLGEDQSLGKFVTPWKHLPPLVAERAHNRSYLVGVHDRAVELRR